MKYMRFISILSVTVILLLCGCTKNTGTAIAVTPELDKAVSDAILERNKDSYYRGECQAEGHIIFEAEKAGTQTILYSYIGYSEYGFENGNFVDISGTVCPAVIKLDENNKLIEIKYPEDGNLYTKSIKKMFPKSCVNDVLNLSDKERKSIVGQLKEYAKSYLISIGRDAPIGSMKDFEYPLLVDMGVSVDVDNSLHDTVLKNKPYPYWVGNRELTENGIRYVYQMDYDKNENKIIYTKYQYDNPDNISEKIVINSLTGEISSPY